jgi:23S rRNA (adenine2030-N6)-methyltransferase
MLSYQHAYHAGGPADVHKHVALCLLLEHLAKKPKPFSVTDLYAGEGEYKLDSFAAQKTQDYTKGIEHIWNGGAIPPDAPPAVQSYLALLRRFNPEETLRHYPGSPAIARAFMRENDRLVLNELHSTAFPELGRWARKDARIVVHQRDGLEALAGLVPPPVRRGLVLIDPSFEVKSEYTDIPGKVSTAVHKWREGIYLIWYPILKEGRHQSLLDGLKVSVDAAIFVGELTLAAKRDDATPGLRGTGLVVVNPPWQFDSAMADAGAWLARKLGKSHKSLWLKRETV